MSARFCFGLIAMLVLAMAFGTPAFELGAETAPPGSGVHGRTGAKQLGASSDDEHRRREGSTFEGEGTVQYAGERLTFVSDDGRERLTMLENLALDRVARTVRDSTVRTHWQVHGTITEYQGTNYLWLERAVTLRRSTELGL